MKVRWTGGSVRFRITPTELGRLADGEEIAVRLTLPGGGWTAALRPGAVRTGLRAAGGQVVFDLSGADLAALSAPEAEGVYFTAAVGVDAALRYFVEKDFPCVHPGAPEAEEAPAETFEPPTGFAERHAPGAACGARGPAVAASPVGSPGGSTPR